MSYGYGGGGYPPLSQQYDRYGHPLPPAVPQYHGAGVGAYDAPPPPPPVPMYGYPAPFPPYHMAPAPHHHMHHMAPPPPDEFRAPPEVAYDPIAFRRFFNHQLDMLRFNSKPAITNLTLFANEHRARMASIVANCMEEHLKNCAPEYKLPALYLLDSISKNIGPPYVALFARFIERVFLHAYRSVDSSIQIKLEELLGTWRTGSPDGGELFRLPEEGAHGRVQRGIEEALFGAPKRNSSQQDAAESGDQINASSFGNSQERMKSLTHPRREDELAQGSSDPVIQEQISALVKLESLVVGTQLTSEQVKQIRSQLAALAPAPATSAPSNDSLPPPPNATVDANGLAAVPSIDMGLLASLQANGGLSSLLASAQQLNRANLSPTPVSTETKAVDVAVDDYNSAVLQVNIRLNNSDFTKWQDHWTSFLYDRLSLQCKQCGMRSFDTVIGKRFMDEHLDWHFTHKRRVREGAGRAQGRSWLALEEDWITADNQGTSGDGTAFSTQGSDNAAVKLDRAALKKSKIPAPTDPAKLARPCPICKEKFKAEWSEADEEWVFYNCVDVSGTASLILFHAICHAEASLSGANMLLRGNDTRSLQPSRESTPTVIKEEIVSSGSAKKRSLEGSDVKPEMAQKRSKS
ncbi:mRNA 3' end processing factor [Microbotryomycetes sp. JL221]|nr:mRNA 3' end processing factor [Microbotryomycetes sp. JL221]